MTHPIIRSIAFSVALAVAWPMSHVSAASPEPQIYGPAEPCLGGVGGVYLLAEPGELAIEVFKRDRNRRGSPAVLRAILVGPDRRVIHEATIPDDGQARGSGWGPVQQTRIAATVDRPGVYALNVTVSQDRYGDEMVWGFATNCPRYLIETSRGHKDERHQEPIVLGGSDQPVNVCFVPRRGPLTIDVSGLPASAEKLELFDAGGTSLGEIPVGDDGAATYTVPAQVARDRQPWRLSLPVRQATVQIDGVTRWDSDDLYPDLSCWTTEPSAHFPLLEYRWLLTPYSRTVYASQGESGETVFRVHNNSGRTSTIRLAVEFPDGAWPVALSAERIELRSKQSAEVTVRYTAPAQGESRICHLRATPVEAPEFTTYSTLEIRSGEAPANKPLALPLTLKPYQHENEQFGYLPDYPLDNQVYFDRENRPFTVTSRGITSLQNGRWVNATWQSGTEGSSGKANPSAYRLLGTKIAFDRSGDVYALASAGSRTALLHSTDGGQTFSIHPLPDRDNPARSHDFEQFSGHNPLDGPPPIVRYALTGSDPKLFWRRLNDLELLVPKIENGRVTVGEPIPISQKCIGLSLHSGIPSSVVSRGDRVHVIWAEATDPAEKVPGVPTYVVTYDRTTGTLGTPALVGYGAPPNDIHNSPSITIDSQGYLHALAGTHGRPFQYARSLEPNDASSGWTEAEPVGKDLPQTYIGLVCGPDDTLHLTYRLWRYGQEPHPHSHHATLAYQRKPSGKPWEEPRVLIVPPFSEYSVYYHRMTIDRLGRLFLSYESWSTFWFYRNDQLGRRRSLIMSADGGTTWQLATNLDP
jgi:hypothetical protein